MITLPAIQSETSIPETPWSRELIKAIAMDVGKEVAAHIEIMYPQAVKATSSIFLLSVRNCVYNQIMAAIEVNDAGQIAARLETRRKRRREWKAAWKKVRNTPHVEGAAIDLCGND